MSTDDKKLSVSEPGAYSAAKAGPVQDTQALDSESGVHGDSEAPAEQEARNRAIPNPMAELRRTARESDDLRRSNSLLPIPRSIPWPVIIGGVAVLFGLGTIGVVIATSGDLRDEPEVQQLEIAAPAGDLREGDAAQTEDLTEIDGVPVRKGLRGE